MNESIETNIDAALSYSPLQPIFQWRASRSLTVLAYHGIDDAAIFERHLDHLRRTRFPVEIDDVARALDRRTGLPRRATLITFDDGDRTVYDVAMPLLQERGLPAVAFVLVGLVGSDQPFWWEEVEDLVAAGAAANASLFASPTELLKTLKSVPNRDRLTTLDELRVASSRASRRRMHLTSEDLRSLERAGIAIGNHTLSHPSLPHCSQEEVVREITEADRSLADILGHQPRSFAYPFGDWDARAAALLADLGYQTAFTFDHRLSAWPPIDALRISRVRVDASTSLDRFRTIISGLHPMIHRFRVDLVRRTNGNNNAS